jgi:predicted alpha/beta superfamily hydrolase
MKQIILIFLTILTANCFCQKIDTLSIKSQILDEQRKLIIYTPWEYDHSENRKFEVIYVFDAQNREIFDMVHLTTLFQNKQICPMIVVGIISQDRNKDFLPINKFKENSEELTGQQGSADKFLNFISSELMPFIDTKYKTLPKKIAIGHSNGGTFITHCFIEKPNLFDAYISIDPSFVKMQFDKRFQNFNLSLINSDKFYYICNSDFKGDEWVKGRNSVIPYFKSVQYERVIKFVSQDFSASDNHWSVVQNGILNGVKEYFNFQFFNSDNLLKYYSNLNKQKLIDLNPQNTNQLAYNFFYDGRPNDALKVLLWANKLFPEDLNLFDSIGEMYQNLGNKPEAMKNYQTFEKKLEEQKSKIKGDDYENMKKGVGERIKSLTDKK